MGEAMGFFRNLFQRKKRKEKEKEPQQENALVLRDGIYSTPEERAGFLKNCCDLINEAKKQQFEAKKEYEVVTSYLADIQKIDLLSERARKSVTEMARRD